MTPFEWTRGRLLATVASLLVKLSRPSFEMAGTGFGYRGDDRPLAAVFEATSKRFSSFGSIL